MGEVVRTRKGREFHAWEKFSSQEESGSWFSSRVTGTLSAPKTPQHGSHAREKTGQARPRNDKAGAKTCYDVTGRAREATGSRKVRVLLSLGRARD